MCVAQVALPLTLDARTSALRDLFVDGATLSVGVRYTLRVTGCMRAEPDVCGSADTIIALADEPLRAVIAGGDRLMGNQDPLKLSVCETAGDADDPTAQCDTNGACGVLRFVWTCELAATAPTTAVSTLSYTTPSPPAPPPQACVGVFPPSTDVCSWEIEPNTLVSDFNYTLSVSVSKPDGESANSSVAIQVVYGALPAVQIAAIRGSKQNPTKKLKLRSNVSVVATGEPGEEDEDIIYEWFIDPPDANLSSSRVTTTGAARNNLVLLPNMLRPGAMYTFELRATYRSVMGKAIVSVLMNRPPFGGSCVSEYDTPVVALSTPIKLTAIQWFDDVDDLPLTYSFGALDLGGSILSDDAAISLGQRSMVASSTWQRPSAGQYALLCFVQDTLNASARVELAVTVDEAEVDDAVVSAVLDDMTRSADEGDLSAGIPNSRPHPHHTLTCALTLTHILTLTITLKVILTFHLP